MVAKMSLRVAIKWKSDPKVKEIPFCQLNFLDQKSPIMKLELMCFLLRTKKPVCFGERKINAKTLPIQILLKISTVFVHGNL